MKILITNRQRHRSLDKPKIERTALSILSCLDRSCHPESELSLLFVSDRIMQQLNTQYRGLKKTTDVLSFEAQLPLKKPFHNTVLGDIVISVPRAETQAEEYGISFDDELCRLMIHGTLHLIGYDHEQSAAMAKKMRKKEEEIFHALTAVD